ncbi:MAG: glycoside hydrolase family 9 protein [Butyrivibrio sp.]|nr:glycoside hydrolase family 9 protein [Butyrivibrio sp.]
MNTHMLSYDYKKKRIIAAGLSLLIMGSVAGCGASSAENTAEVTEHTWNVTTTAAQNVDYEVKTQTPSIFVNQVGYRTTSDKTVVFCAKELPQSFEIRELESGDTVYTGEIIKSVLDEETGKYTAVGRFNDFDKPGEYFVYADIVGESFSFSISDEIYGETFKDACRKYYINRCGIAISQTFAEDNGHSACHTTVAHMQDASDVSIDVTGGWHMDEKADRDTLIGSSIVENLLLAYEINPEAFGDDEGIPESGNEIPDVLDEARYGAEWLLKMQDEKTGGVYGSALTQGSSSGDYFASPVVVTPVSMDATINFAAALARFSYIYQQYDGAFATVALKAADRAYGCFLNNMAAGDNSASFKAAAQLYRATGNDRYNEVLESFFSLEDFGERFNTDENIFLGCVTYLSTSQKVSKEVCDYLIKLLMKRSEDIAKKASDSRFLVSAGLDDMAEFLDDMRCLTVTNHIIYNHEYTTIIENHLHYLMGMNPEGINFVTEDTENTYAGAGRGGVMNDPINDALLIFMMSVLEK